MPARARPWDGPRASPAPLLSLLAAAAGLWVAAWAGDAAAVTHLQRGGEAPAFSLKDADGAEVGTASLRGRAVVLVFGEAYHEKTRQACAAIESALRDPRLAGQMIATVLVTAHEVREEDRALWPGRRLPPRVARDADRRAFGAYRVTVMPSVVVIDAEGRVVHAVAGLGPRAQDVLGDALLHAAGRLGADALERSLRPAPATRPSDEATHAGRVARLARQLERRGLPEMAAEKYREALGQDPKHVEARLGLGAILLRERRLADAEEQFRAALAEQPDCARASLGLAFVQAQRGDRELEEAEKTVRAVLARTPASARAHYLLGVVQERRDKPADAAASFRKAAELLLERSAEPE